MVSTQSISTESTYNTYGDPMCPKCRGLMVRELYFESVTGSTPCFYCVNCGNYTDPVIRRNKAMTPAELANTRLNDAEFPASFQFLRSA